MATMSYNVKKLSDLTTPTFFHPPKCTKHVGGGIMSFGPGHKGVGLVYSVTPLHLFCSIIDNGLCFR